MRYCAKVLNLPSFFHILLLRSQWHHAFFNQQNWRLSKGLSKFDFGHWIHFPPIFSPILVQSHFQRNVLFDKPPNNEIWAIRAINQKLDITQHGVQWVLKKTEEMGKGKTKEEVAVLSPRIYWFLSVPALSVPLTLLVDTTMVQFDNPRWLCRLPAGWGDKNTPSAF